MGRHWSSEMQALLRLSSDDEFLSSVIGFMATLTQARAGFLFAPGSPKPQCLFSRMRGRIQPALLQAPDLVNAIAQSLEKGAVSRLEISNAEESAIFVSMPVNDLSGKGRWAFCAWFGPERLENIEDAVALMQTPALLLEQRKRLGRVERLETGFSQATLFLEMLSRAGAEVDFERAMATLSHELSTFLECHQVAIGLGNRRRCKVAAISGAGKFDQSAQPTALVSAMLEESIGVQSAIAWPYTRDLPRGLMVSGNHDRLLEALGVDFVIAIPLKTEDGAVIGSWMALCKGNGAALLRKWDVVESMTAHVAGVARLIQAGKPRGALGKWRKSVGGITWTRRGIIAGVLAAIALILWIPIREPITADCRLEPVVTRQIAAPFDGVLARPEVKPGTLVKQGQLLATLDGKEIGWRLAEAVSKRDAALKRRAQGIAMDQVAETQLADLEVKARELEVALLTHQRNHLEILAPMDGLVLRGDLEQSEGVPVAKGQQLFEIAKIDNLRVEIALPDAEISRVKPGLQTSLRLESQAHYQRETVLEKVDPASVTQGHRNVFLGHASVKNESGELRPGMEGKARILGERRPLGWVLFHKPLDYLRLRLWY